MDLDKRVRICMLLDFYGELLTEKQQEIMHKYYEEDVSLVEIGDELFISRQAVRDALKVSENSLELFENKLGFIENHNVIKNNISEIINNIDSLSIEEIKSSLKSLSKIL